MSKLILMALTVTLFQTANAKVGNNKVVNEELFSAEELTLDFAVEEAEIEDQLFAEGFRNDDQVSDFGDILGGVLGGILRDRLGHRRVVCKAENGRGRIFRAEGRQPMRVRARAMRKCRNNSRRARSCYSLGCHRVGRHNDDFDRPGRRGPGRRGPGGRH